LQNGSARRSRSFWMARRACSTLLKAGMRIVTRHAVVTEHAAAGPASFPSDGDAP
jgi:hypothetical protein